MHDVVISGAGPNGLMLACELSLSGIRPLVLEKLHDRGRRIRAQGLVGTVVQVLDYRGLFSRMSDAPAPEPTPFFNFAGLPLDLRALEDNPLHVLTVPQPELERTLEERALELGVDIRRGHELLDLSQDEDSVTVEVRGPDGDYTLTAGYLVGCDGARSTVRKRAGIGFPDTGNQDLISRAADVSLPESYVGGIAAMDSLLQESAWLEMPERGRVPFGFTRTDTGYFAIGTFLPGRYVVGTVEWGRSAIDRDAPMTVEEMRESTARVLGEDLPMEPLPGDPEDYRLHRLIGDTRQADRYQLGRVLLAGDAAHVHHAANAPGLNLGLQDTVNLGWKLAARIHGWAPKDLLDTYHSERQPVGARVLMQTQAQTALIFPGPDVTALRSVFTEMLKDKENLRYIARLMSGADIRYDMGTTAEGDPEHPAVGRWAPDFTVTTPHGEQRLSRIMHTARPVLIDLTDGSGVTDTVSGWKDRVDTVQGAPAENAPARALLVRPDGFVAWATDATAPGEDDLRGLRDALARWFGVGR
ncbi:FAD-dependent monooxygenase [Nocardiopsis deserti]|uniref:FAD-dependent monooxygenase n=1 Tax=Nocardiopsis deserti TaxID=2605988 RepID=UPI001239E240|nr:FAD-dependent monooxygenase [Nocardiopsis deserti]